MYSSLTADNNEKVTNWILTGISSETIKAFDINLKPIMSSLANCRVILQFNNSVLVKKVIFYFIGTCF